MSREEKTAAARGGAFDAIKTKSKQKSKSETEQEQEQEQGQEQGQSRLESSLFFGGSWGGLP